ncbi:MAG: phosphoenolpyruvate carboxykinase (GTP) [SAR202 cluster bacterium]|nr:phosphoenolpyruvate carboxykinase (GTP) [SAR202 cluster bacterium]
MEQNFLEFIKTLPGRSNVQTLSVPELDDQARHYGRRTQTESLSFYSNVRNRNARDTVVFGSDRVASKKLTERQKTIAEKKDQTLKAVQAYLERAPLIRVQRTIGDNSSFNPKCNLFLSVQRSDNVRQACLWSHTLRDYSPSEAGPELYQVCIPEWPEEERQVLVFPEINLNVVLGIDYVGEVKMGFLRMAMWDAKEEGMLSLHAGSKTVTARQNDGKNLRYGMIFFGLSGTGKTTHSCHNHGLTARGEDMDILQDDIVFLAKDGSALGTERGFYLKTEGLHPETQAVVWKALEGPEALFENVMLTDQGKIDYADLSLGGNGRAIIPRANFAPYVGSDINLPSADKLDGLIVAFITRRMTVLPLASKLNPEQAAAAFMLGESVETSAGDPRRAGESVRVVGTNPFLLGSEADEGNWFYDFVKRNESRVQCYLLNTGGVGEIIERSADGRAVIKQRVNRIAIPEMAAIIRGIVRNTIEWEKEPHFGTLVPKKVDGADLSKYDLSKFYTKQQIDEYVLRLKDERKKYLAGFPGLNAKVVNALG